MKLERETVNSFCKGEVYCFNDEWTGIYQGNSGGIHGIRCFYFLNDAEDYRVTLVWKKGVSARIDVNALSGAHRTVERMGMLRSLELASDGENDEQE